MVEITLGRLGSLVLVVAAACGDGGGGGDGGGDEPVPGVVDPARARTSVEQLGRISASMSAMDAADVFQGVLAWGHATNLIVGSSDGSGHLVFPQTTVPVTPNTGTATCTEALCTFGGYGLSVTYTIYTLGGTITRSGPALELDLTANFVEHTRSMRWTIGGSVEVTPAGVDGAAHALGTGKAGPLGEQVDVAREAAVDYEAVALDAQGCPIGGALSARTRHDEPGAGFHVEGSVAFGPACGAAR